MKQCFAMIVALSICIVASGAVRAFAQDETQQSTADNSVYRYREIVVQEKKEQAGSVSILTEKEINRSNRNDLIGVIGEYVPSFHSGDNRVMGYGLASSNPAKSSIRGMGVSSWGPTTGIVMLFDGIDPGAHIFSHTMPDVFGMRNVERLEVYLGPQPVLFGSGAMAGAVNVITKRQEVEGYRTKVSASYGSFNSTDDYIHHQGKLGSVDWAFSYGFRRTDGHREETVSDTECTSEAVMHTGTARVGVQLGEHFYANVNSYLIHFLMNDPGPDNGSVAVSGLEVFDVTRGGASLSLHHSYEKFEGFAQVYYNQGNHEITRPDTDAITFESVDKTYSAKLQETVKAFAGNKVTLGLEYKKYGGDITGDDAADAKMDEEYLEDRSIYGMASQRLFDIVTLSAGGRYTDNNEYGGFNAYQGGVIVNPIRSMKLFVNAAKGFTIPGVRYRYNKTGPGIDANADLEPERVDEIEAGVEQTLFDMLTLGVTGYKVYSENKIIIQTGKWMNSDVDIDYPGVEASLRFNCRDMFGLNAGYSWIDHEYEDSTGATTVLPYVPKHKAVFGVNVTWMGVYAGLNGEYVRTVYQTYPGQKLDNYFVLNARVAYKFLDRYEVFVNLNNLTDREYVSFMRGTGAYPVAGFNWMLGASAEF